MVLSLFLDFRLPRLQDRNMTNRTTKYYVYSSLQLAFYHPSIFQLLVRDTCWKFGPAYRATFSHLPGLDVAAVIIPKATLLAILRPSMPTSATPDMIKHPLPLRPWHPTVEPPKHRDGLAYELVARPVFGLWEV
jgi:hypothetical protein